MAFSTKVYVVQRADRNGQLKAETPVAVKLTFQEARAVAILKGIAPAKITLIFADKTNVPNGEGQIGHYSVCQSKPLKAKRLGIDSLDATSSSLSGQKDYEHGLDGDDDFG